MLEQATYEQLADMLKMDEEGKKAFVAAATSPDAAKVELPTDINVLTKAELAQRDKSVGDTRYTAGKTAGEEMMVKTIKQKAGIEVEGKDVDTLITSFQSKVLEDAKIEPNKALAEKDQTIAKLQQNIGEFQTQIEQEKENAKKLQLAGRLKNGVPKGMPVDPDVFLYAMQSKGYKFEQDDTGAIIPTLNGQKMVDATTQTPLDFAEVMKDFGTKEWGETQSKTGRGGNSSTGKHTGLETKYSQVAARFTADGKSENGIEFQTAVTEAAKKAKAAGEDFDFKS